MSRLLSAWVQVPLGVVLTAAGVVGATTYVDSQRTEQAAAAGVECPAGTVQGDRDDCLVRVAGAITETRGRTSLRHHFVPDDLAADDDWVRLPGNERDRGGATRELLAGAPVEALYVDDSVVAFDVAGERLETMDGEAGASRRAVWGSLWLGSLGVIALVGAWQRRRGRADGSRRPPHLGNAALLAVSLGSMAAIFPSTLRGELIAFAVVGGPFLLLAVVGWVRRRRPREVW